MANIGEAAEIINASKWTLEVGSDAYIALTNLNLHIGRTEERTPITGAGSLYSQGKGDSWFTATLTLTTPEIDTAYTNKTTAAGWRALAEIGASGDSNLITWKIVATNVSGNPKTFTADGYLRNSDYTKPGEGKIFIDVDVRITDEPEDITVT